MHGKLKQKRTSMPSFFTYFFSFLGKAGQWQRSTIAPKRINRMRIPRPWVGTTVVLGTTAGHALCPYEPAHSILPFCQLRSDNKAQWSLLPPLLLVCPPTLWCLACLSVAWDLQMVSQYSARQIQNCLIPKIKPMWQI